jgi:hypothetical protein
MTKEEVDAAITALENWGRALDSWTLLCAIGIAVFLALGVVLGFAHWINEKHLRPLRIEHVRLHDLQVSVLQRDTARLTTEAEIAREAIGDANARALEAQAELEKLRAPRRLASPEQRARMLERLRQFAGQQFFGALAGEAADAWSLRASRLGAGESDGDAGRPSYRNSWNQDFVPTVRIYFVSRFANERAGTGRSIK